MKRLRVCTLLNRWRHTHGFGVHSPMAYAFLENIVRLPYACYADARYASREERLLHRIAARMNPETVYFDSGVPDALREAVLDADSRFSMLDCVDESSGRLLAVFGSNPDSGQLRAASACIDAIVYMADAPAADPDALCVGRSTGILFRSPRKAILIASPRMAFVTYDICL